MCRTPFRVWGSGLLVQGFGFRVSGSGFWVQFPKTTTKSWSPKAEASSLPPLGNTKEQEAEHPRPPPRGATINRTRKVLCRDDEGFLITIMSWQRGCSGFNVFRIPILSSRIWAVLVSDNLCQSTAVCEWESRTPQLLCKPPELGVGE